MRFKGKQPICNIKDTWSLDNTLSPIISAGLRKFKEVITSDKYKDYCGVPSIILKEVFPEGGSVDNYNFSNEQLKGACDVWYAYIDEMIYAFDNKEPDIGDYSFEFVAGEGHGDVVDEEGSTRYNMEADNKEEHERYKLDTSSHEERVQAGLVVFGKYYSNLWW